MNPIQTLITKSLYTTIHLNLKYSHITHVNFFEFNDY